MADIDNVTVGENNYNLRDSAAQNALPTQGQVDDIITALNTIADKTDHPYNPDNKLPSDYVNDANQTHKFATQAQLTQIETNKTNILLSLDANGAKNLLDYSIDTLKADANNVGGIYDFSWNGNVCTSTKGVTLTVNSDNSISVVASSATYDVWFRLKRSFTYEAGNTYILSGCPSGGSTSTYYLESDNLNLRDTGDTTTISQSSAYTDDIYLVIKTGTTYSGTFKPMICEKSLWDISHKYEPYALSNVDLTTLSKQNQTNILLTADQSTKYNILPVTLNSGTISDVTFTVNADKSISTSGTASANITNAYINISFTLPTSGEYVLCGCASGGSSASTGSYRLDMLDGGISGTQIVADTGSGAVFTPSQFQNTTACVRLRIGSGANMNGKTFKPMIIPKAIYDAGFTDYQPYAMSNVDLTTLSKQNQTNILWTYSETSYAPTNVNVYEYTGVSFTVPANTVYEFYVSDRNSSNIDTSFSSGIIVNDSTLGVATKASIIAENTQTPTQAPNFWLRTVNGITPKRNSSTTYYIWVNRSSSGASGMIMLAYRQLVF